MQFSIQKPHFFDKPKILQKHSFDTLWHYLCFYNGKKHCKTGEKQQKKTWTSF